MVACPARPLPWVTVAACRVFAGGGNDFSAGPSPWSRGTPASR